MTYFMTKIILVSGGTCVGTSKYSLELANILHIPTIISTDAIREILRSTLNPHINPLLNKSTYLAGQTENYCKKSEEVQRAEIIRAFKTQCAAIRVGIDGLVKRSIVENIPLIVEGVHVIPGSMEELDIFNKNQQISQYLIKISDPKIHKSRFEQRQKEAPKREIKKYLSNFREIRWIHDYLVEKANKSRRVKQIDNIGSIREGIDIILKDVYS